MESANSICNEWKKLLLVYGSYKNHLSIGKIGGLKLIVVWIIWLSAFLMFGPKLIELIVVNTPNFVALFFRTDIDNYWVFKLLVLVFATLYFVARLIGKNSSVSFLFLLLLPVYLYVRFWSTNTIEVYPVDNSFKFIDLYCAFFLPQVLTWFYYSVVAKWRDTVSLIKEKWKWYRELNIESNEPYHYLDYDLPSEVDNLDRDLLVDSFAGLLKAINAEERSVAIGVQGEWGHGKSSFILQVLNQLRKDSVFYKDVVIIEFNPWLYGSGNLIHSFLKQFSEALPVLHRNIESDIKQYAKSLSFVEENLLSTSFTKELSGEVATADELYETLSNQVANTGVKFIVVIDDLDRLYKKEILEVLRMIRQVAAFSNLIYIVAYDKDHVLESINSELGYGNNDKGGCFTDKIFQHEINLPTIPDEVLIRVFKLSLDSIVVELKERNINLDYSKFELISDFRYVPLVFKNIREIKRFLNSFISRAVIKDLGSGIDLYQFFLLEVLYFFEREHYKVIYDKRSDVLSRYNEEINNKPLEEGKSSKEIGSIVSSLMVYAIDGFKLKNVVYELFRYGINHKPINSFFSSVNNEAYFFLDTRFTGIAQINERIELFEPMGFEPDDSFLEMIVRDNKFIERVYSYYFDKDSSTRSDYELARGIDILFHYVLYHNYRLKTSFGSYVALYSEKKNKTLETMLTQVAINIGNDRFHELALTSELVFVVLLLIANNHSRNSVFQSLAESTVRWRVTGKGSIIALKELRRLEQNYQSWKGLEKEVKPSDTIEIYYNCFASDSHLSLKDFPHYLKTYMPTYVYEGVLDKLDREAKEVFCALMQGYGSIPMPHTFSSELKARFNDTFSELNYDLRKGSIRVSLNTKDIFWRFGFHIARSEKELNFDIGTGKRERENVYLYHIGRAGIQSAQGKIINENGFFVQRYSNNYNSDNKQEKHWNIEPNDLQFILLEIKLINDSLLLFVDDKLVVEEKVDSGYRFAKMAAWADFRPYNIHVELWNAFDDSEIENFLNIVGVER